MPAEGNVGIAFALVIGAGLSTTIGACAAFFAKLASPRWLALSLGLSAGVMLYVSFVEIFMQKGVTALVEGGWGEPGYRWGTMLFFGGMVITALLDVVVHMVSKAAGLQKQADSGAIAAAEPGSSVSKDAKPAAPLVTAEQMEAGAATEQGSDAAPSEAGTVQSAASESEVQAIEEGGKVHLTQVPQDMPAEAAARVDTYITNDHHRFGLQKMGVLTALAIGIHNLPEGLATFVAALSDPLNGVAIAVAIALHNIPEGVCVAMPIYYATGSRRKGFLWAFISGLSEPVGGLLGYLVLYGNRTSDIAYGVLFCVVAGMMTFISIQELVPTALKYDPHNKVTSVSIIAGMVIMAASLLLFTI